MKRRRVVTLNEGFQRHGKRARLWGYGYPDLAELFGMSEGAVRQAVWDKRLNPGDLREVVRWANERRNDTARSQALEGA